ncbi:Uncharacterised protein [Bordetella ansorpii]|uniref:Lipoprotein n=1 Tax=Bordetella ansorpii TaxID=288768 RepID=A0A157SN93_9BORD|nr:hypothetical protein [Bordetella ansorpii]SAI71959.1 Uncharacterised protein [Bordetella ansorpii]
MTTPPFLQKKTGRPLLACGALCLALLLSACGSDDDDTSPPPGDGGGGTPPAACTSAHCAPAP